MLSRAFEWYRVVDAQPSSQTIDSRRAAVIEIIAAIDAATTPGLALDCAEGVVAGFGRGFTTESTTIATIVEAIRRHQSAFPADLSENALELRVCAAIALGELLVRDLDNAPSKRALSVAAALRSGLGSRPTPSERFLGQLTTEIHLAADAILARAASLRRTPGTSLSEQIGALGDGTEAGATLAINLPPLKAALIKTELQLRIVQEETNVLWWMFAGSSTTTGQSLAGMPIGAAVLCCGAELADHCLSPALSSLEHMVRRACENGRKAAAMKPRTIEEIVTDWTDQLPNIVVPDEATRLLARQVPALLPMSWLSDRRTTSGLGAGWEVEFASKVDWPLPHRQSPSDWAVQVFAERMAHRLIAA